MKKIYRLTAFFFIMAAVFFSALIIIFQKDARGFLSAINSIDSETLTILRPTSTALDLANGPINLDLFNNPKFKDLVKSQVDMTGVTLPNQTKPTTTMPATPTTTEPAPDFKVGNSNPFKAF